MDKARVVITPEQFTQASELNVAVHRPVVQHRSTGWQRWRGWCETCQQGSSWGNQADASDWVADHSDDFPPPPECSCWNAEHLEHEPRDCPLHKETQK